LKKTIHAILQSHHVAIGFPASNCHTSPPSAAEFSACRTFDDDHSIKES
jgi:hypothetical protein